MENLMKTVFIISGKKYTLKYERKMPEKEVIKMKSFVTNLGDKLVKTSKFKIKKITEKDKERNFEITL
tara:strand:- start:2250 stop:2453 length:204 start_codon:yes stop_codon:yes gene_type:complete